jgi:hypothetical protein
MVISSCVKKPYYGESCDENCYIISGLIQDDSTGEPMSDVYVLLQAKRKNVMKDIVADYTNNKGYWRMSFDADYIEDLKEGTLIFKKESHLTLEQKITFDPNEIDFGKSYIKSMNKLGHVYFKINLTNEEVQKLQARYIFDGISYTTDLRITDITPQVVNFMVAIPAYSNIDISLFYSTSTNPNSWIVLKDPTTFYVGFQENAFLEIDF